MEAIISKSLNITKIRLQFPILNRSINGKPLVYLDNGATTQKPQRVIDAITRYYTNENANIHRGVHTLSQLGTDAYEATREKVRDFIGAKSTNEVIFSKGTTDSINLVAATFGRQNVKAGDSILISSMEHHSNIVPWQMLCEEKGAKLNVIPINNEGEIIYSEFLKLLETKPKLLSIVYVSNALGTINPIKQMIADAHCFDIRVLIDGAQAVQHLAVDVQDLDADFFVFSGHKMYGPTGVGILYGKEALLNAMPPYQGGGDMIKTVSFEKTEYNELPFKFEAGTPNIEGCICLGEAIDFIQETGIDNIAEYEKTLLGYATQKLQEIEGLKIIGTAKEKSSVISFNIEGIHPYDAGLILDKMGIAVRTGHHCTQPLMNFFQIPGTIRASFACYNTFAEIDKLVEGILKVKKMMS